MGGLIYEGGVLKTISHDEGFIKIENGQINSPNYQFIITDHLGNTRAIVERINETTALVQETHYYPYGAVMEGVGLVGDWDFLFQGKEYIDFFGYDAFDFHARILDTWTGRFSGLDPIAYYSLSGYSSMMNNPISYIDPDGRNPLFIGAFVAIFANTAIKMAKGESINSMWDFLKPGIAGAVGGAFAAGAPSALFSSLGKNIGYGVLSGGVTGGVSDIVNGGNGSGALWGAVTGGAFAGLNWGLDRSFFENSLHDINTAMVKAGDPDDPILLNQITVRAPRNKLLDQYGQRAAVNGFFGNLNYYWNGGLENGLTYDRQGYPYAYAPIMGAPDLIGGTAGGLYNGAVKITGFTKHGLNRAIERGIKPQSILDAVKNPLKISEQVIDDFGRISQRFVGRSSEVVINPTTGKVLSVNPTSSSKVSRLLKQLGLR